MNGRAASPPSTSQPADTSTVGSSPQNPRKRTNDAVYFASQPAHASPSRDSEALRRPSTAPEQNMQRQMAAQSTFKHNVSVAVHSHQDPLSSISAPSTLKPENLNASTNTTAENPRTFQSAIKDFQDQLDEEYREFAQKLIERDRDAELDEFDWDELEARYRAVIDPKVEAECGIMNECSHLFQHFLIWMQTSNEREADRALKRLRTRMAVVQNSEEKLRETKAHYSKVVNAFHSAMALLGNI